MSDADLPPAAISGRKLTAMAEEAFGQRVCCWKCWQAANPPGTWGHISHPMFLCPMCGCKRCPKSSDHELACTGSNEAGQPGSVYA